VPQSQLEVLALDTLQLRTRVELIRALGGGWADSALAQSGKVGAPQALDILQA
jgi:outer membrane protein TolC